MNGVISAPFTALRGLLDVHSGHAPRGATRGAGHRAFVLRVFGGGHTYTAGRAASLGIPPPHDQRQLAAAGGTMVRALAVRAGDAAGERERGTYESSL